MMLLQMRLLGELYMSDATSSKVGKTDQTSAIAAFSTIPLNPLYLG